MLTLDVGCGGRCRGDVALDIAIPPNRPKFFVRADAATFPFRDKVFDEAFSFFCFEHLKNLN